MNMFLNPIMLAGLAGAVVPLALHFLSKARYRNMDWGAMMFLETSKARRHHGSRLKEMTILLLRMAIVAMLAMALSRPVLGGRAAVSQQTSQVILLDRSASLDIDENGPPRVESARRAAVQALGTLRPGDEAALVLLPEPTQTLAIPQFTTDLQSLVARVNDARTNPTQGRCDISVGLTAAARLLENSRAPNRQIVVVSDRQAVNWREITKQFALNWRQSVAQPGGRLPQFSVISIGGFDAGNVAIESVRILNPPVVRNVPVELEIVVRNYDTIPSANLTLSVGPASFEVHREPLNLPAGGEKTVHCTVRVPFNAQAFITTRITPTAGLSFDDSLETVVDVMSSIGVLVVTGEHVVEKPGSFRAANELIRLALAPTETSGRANVPDLARVEIVSSSDELPPLDVANHRVVVLANAPRLSEAQVRSLEQYVYSGGGLLVAPGNLVRAEEYNARLWRSGAGILPAQLEAPTSADGSEGTSLLGLDINHQIFRFLKDRVDPLPKVAIGRYFPARVTEPRSKVIGRYASGRPFLVEGSYGRGRVLMLTTSLDADWNTLWQTNSYLPFLQSAVRYLASSSLQNRNLNVGEPIVATFEKAIDPRVTLSLPPPSPPQAYVTLEPVRIGDGSEVTYANTNRRGQYWLYSNTGLQGQNMAFNVRDLRDESNLSPLTAQRSEELSQMLGVEWVESDSQSIVSALTRSRRHRELWPYLMGVVIAMGILEQVLERSWTTVAPKEAAP